MARSKLKKFKKLKKMHHMIQPDRDELLNDAFSLKGCWGKKFGNDNPIVIELGCGKGEYTVGLAELSPQYNYIGIDIKGSRMYTGAEVAESKNLKNVYFLRTQIEYLECVFGINEISEIWITFPDPQIKFNRRKKRLVFPNFLKKYKKIMKKEGVVNLKTDSMFLHGYTLGLLENGPYKVIKSMHDIYNNFHNDNRLNIKTHYETIFLNNNQPISFLSFSFL
mgnify:CR=1 FL=1|tara:strand:- start:251 stop:916 length:666 start_codon:yes stop_codon:yes gene_type:complete